MEPKTQTDLLFLLERAAHHVMPLTTQQEWKHAYDDFCGYLEQITSSFSFIPVMRAVEALRIELADLYAHLDPENLNGDAAQSFCNKALETVRAELQMLDLRLRYPEIVSERQPKLPTLYLNEEYTLTDLVELIVALYELKVFRTPDGRKAHLITLVRIFEFVFNVSLPNFEVMRTAALNRKIQVTKFVDKMRMTLIELSQR